MSYAHEVNAAIYVYLELTRLPKLSGIPHITEKMKPHWFIWTGE